MTNIAGMDEKRNVKLKICSLNTRGLRNEKKRKKLFYWLKERMFDIVCLQETFLTEELEDIVTREWAGKTFHSFSNSHHSKGVSVLFRPHLDLSLLSIYKDCEGRRVLVNFHLNTDTVISIASIYAPTILAQRVDFFKRTSKWLNQYCASETMLIVSGDFNCVYREVDRTSHTIDSSSKQFLDLQKYNDLHDLHKTSNPISPMFTWIDPADPSHQSRIDYILASTHLTNLATDFQTILAPISDHNALVATFDNISKIRGPGFWKLNTDLLGDAAYVDIIQRVIASTVDEYQYSLDKRSLWEITKIKIKEISIKYSKQKARSKVSRVKILEDKLKTAYCLLANANTDNTQLNDEILQLKREINEFYEYKSKGYQIRSRAKWVEQGEQSTSYFLRLEKKHQVYNQIDTLMSDNGQMARTNEEILKEAVSFYTKLYSSTSPSANDIDIYLENTNFVHKLSPESRNICEGLISKEECHYAVKHLKDNKSPGLDGLCAEFYKKFWPEIETLLTDCYNESFQKGELSESQKLSILSLIFKKTDRTQLKYYRPISLATTDYKILAFVLANRLNRVIANIVSSDQTGYIKGRFIGTNIRLISDIIEHADRINVGGAILFLDFEKAFDSLEWDFMLKTLICFNFGDSFIKWVEILYKNPESMIKINGWLSSKLSLTRGIRQGCPISALLFILAVEILALNVKQNQNIKGFVLNERDQKMVKLSQYADDTISILRDHTDIPEMLNVISKFGDVSGLRLNLPKTEGIWLGRDKNNPDMYGIKFTSGPVRCLGIYVGHNKGECYKKNWIDKLEKFQKLLDCWRLRDLTLFGKVIIIKTLAISQLVFSATCCPVTDETKKQIVKSIYQFLWHKRDRIKRTSLICDQNEGGIRMLDIDSFFDALKAAWVKRIINSDGESWSILPKDYYGKLGPRCMPFKVNFTKTKAFPFIDMIPTFYQQVLIGYNKTKPLYNVQSNSNIGNELIWGNAAFIENKKGAKMTLYFKNWISSGIFYIKNLKFRNGKIDETFIYERVADKRNIYVETKILNMALQPFKEKINSVQYSEDVSEINSHKLAQTDETMSITKYFYNCIIENIKNPPNLHKWEQRLNYHMPHDGKSIVYNRKIVAIKENKIKEFNFKVLNNILACNSLVSKWDDSKSGNCEICALKDDIYHLLFKCTLAQSVWNTVATHIHAPITDIDVFLGVDDTTQNYLYSLISFIIYKYWLVCSKNDKARTQVGLFALLKEDLSFKADIYRYMKKGNIYNTLNRIAHIF